MELLGDMIHLCPVCGSEALAARGKAEIACGSCGTSFDVVPDPRVATLKLTVKTAGRDGMPAGATVLSIPNPDLVNEFIAAQAK